MRRCWSEASRRRRIVGTLGIALLVAASIAAARPGSGQSYSGGSRSSGGGSGGGGDGGALAELVIWLLFQQPIIGVPLLGVVVVVLIVKSVSKTKNQGWATTSIGAPAGAPVEPSRGVPRVALDEIRALDPGFSVVLFEDFVYMLYAAIQRARATGMQSIAAYVAPEVAQSLTCPTLKDVHGIIIGAMRTVHFSGIRDATLEVEVEIEANFEEQPQSGSVRRFYVVDRLLLTRAASARSRPIERAQTLDCPNCGAPLEAVRGTQCSYCREDVGSGRFDWMVRHFSNVKSEPRGPLLTSNVREEGTDLPTIVDAGAMVRFQELQQRDPTLTWEAIESRVAHVFAELQVAWSGRDAKRIRPYVSDNLFQSMVYWIDLYTQQRCRNVTDNARILRVEIANILGDMHYDAVTVRLYATSLDYTVSDDGRILSGSRSRPRAYSEYWTLIRSAHRKGATRGNDNCPNCQAPLKVGMTGNCEFCRVKVTSGDFDWVLSRIEQDEAYTG